MTFCDFQKDIDNNMFDFNFLSSCYGKFFFQLNQIFDERKGTICCFLHEEFQGRDPISGKSWSVPLRDCIKYSEQVNIAQMKAENLPIPAEFDNCFFLCQRNFFQKNAHNKSINLKRIRNLTIFENAIRMFSLYEYKFRKEKLNRNGYMLGTEMNLFTNL